MNKLAAIFNVWDGAELLNGSLKCLKGHVDAIIIVYQDVSNYGEKYDPSSEFSFSGFPCVFHKYTPFEESGFRNEINKRNIGLTIARELECTHFLHMDCDEYYEDFGAAKGEYFEKNPQGGSVCKMFTYFKSPTLRLENEDNYHVPFIHKLNPGTTAGHSSYPFYVDPTRKINVDHVIELSTRMHHFSYVRKDIERKTRNSSAKINIERSQLLQDYHSDQVKSGFFVKDFNQKLIEVPNQFNIKL